MSSWDNKGWTTHSLGSWDREWESYKSCAALAGMTVNGWVRSWLNEAVRFEKMNQEETNAV